jgi:hypothetical protein
MERVMFAPSGGARQGVVVVVYNEPKSFKKRKYLLGRESAPLAMGAARSEKGTSASAAGGRSNITERRR